MWNSPELFLQEKGFQQDCEGYDCQLCHLQKVTNKLRGSDYLAYWSRVKFGKLDKRNEIRPGRSRWSWIRGWGWGGQWRLHSAFQTWWLSSFLWVCFQRSSISGQHGGCSMSPLGANWSTLWLELHEKSKGINVNPRREITWLRKIILNMYILCWKIYTFAKEKLVFCKIVGNMVLSH